MNIKQKALSVLALVCFSYQGLWAHKFHASLTEIEYKKESESFQIVLRLFPDDLEMAVNKMAGEKIKFENNSQTNKLVMKYIQSKFTLQDNAKTELAYKWVGIEWEVDVVWVYLEINSISKIQGFRVNQHIFIDLYSNQMNTVNFKNDTKKSTHIFKKSDGFKWFNLF